MMSASSVCATLLKYVAAFCLMPCAASMICAQTLMPPSPYSDDGIESVTSSTLSRAFDPIDDKTFFDPQPIPPVEPARTPSAVTEVTETANTQAAATPPVEACGNPKLPWTLDGLVSPERFRGSASTFLFLGAVSLAPALLLMTTSFVRLSIVFTLLRQAIGAQVLPSNQILTTLAMFLTVCVMWPTWTEVYDEAIVPYTEGTQALSATEAFNKGVTPVRRFMSNQIEQAGNSDNVMMFYETLPSLQNTLPESYEEVPLRVLLPAYLLSELKVAFLLGFQIYLPFLVIDVFVSAVTTSMGMLMLPPLSLSLPLKLIVFVLVDGWNLLAGTLITSFVGAG